MKMFLTKRRKANIEKRIAELGKGWRNADSDEESDMLYNDECELFSLLQCTENAVLPDNEWFIGFCKSLKPGQYLTIKQIGIFSKYAPTDKVIVDCKIYTLIERYVTIQEFSEIWKEYI